MTNQAAFGFQTILHGHDFRRTAMPMRVPQRAEMAQEAPLLGGVEVSPDRLVQGGVANQGRDASRSLAHWLDVIPEPRAGTTPAPSSASCPGRETPDRVQPFYVAAETVRALIEDEFSPRASSYRA